MNTTNMSIDPRVRAQLIGVPVTTFADVLVEGGRDAQGKRSE